MVNNLPVGTPTFTAPDDKSQFESQLKDFLQKYIAQRVARLRVPLYGPSMAIADISITYPQGEIWCATITPPLNNWSGPKRAAVRKKQEALNRVHAELHHEEAMRVLGEHTQQKTSWAYTALRI